MFSSVPVFPPKNFIPFTFTPHIQYGKVDGVPLLLEQTEQMHKALKAVGVEVTLLPTEWGHGWGTGWYEVAQQYLAFFQRHLCGWQTTTC